jgi:hypothetical protein
MKIIIILLIGYLVGRIYCYYKNRIQCVNCGSFNTHKSAAAFSYTRGGKSNFVVKEWESHHCEKCGQGISIKIEIIKYD